MKPDMDSPAAPPQGACVTIYCGSSPGADPAFISAARRVGAAVAAAGAPLVYGCGRMGMMYAAASACRGYGGTTIGVIPAFMVERGWADNDSTSIITTDGMALRKERMARLAAGAIALPGGIGTFEELVELITWRQLGLYHGNIVVLNVSGYFDPLLAQLSRAVECGFMPADHAALWEVTDSPELAVTLALRPEGKCTPVLNPKFKI